MAAVYALGEAGSSSTSKSGLAVVRHSHRTVIDVLQQAARAFVVKRKFKKAKMLVHVSAT